MFRSAASPALRLVSRLAWVTMLCSASAFAQSYDRDNGNCVSPSGEAIVACWNPLAGWKMREKAEDFSENNAVYQPHLKGWDFRINLPHVRFQLADSGRGSAAALAGVIENATLDTWKAYSHTNNSIWMTRVRESDHRVYYKVVPSRRALNGTGPENIESLTEDWVRVGPSNSPDMMVETPAIAVLGAGIPGTTVFAAARSLNSAIHLTERPMTSTNTASWTTAWAALGVDSTVPPVLIPAFGRHLALATVDAGNFVRVQLYDPATQTWGLAVRAFVGTRHAPKLIWDGTALNVFVVSTAGKLRHTYATRPTLDFGAASEVAPLLSVYNDAFDVIFFNARFHVAAVQDTTSTSAMMPVWYTSTKSSPGHPSTWSIMAETGVVTRSTPAIVNYNDNLFVAASGVDGRVRYSRRNPNRRGNDLSMATFAEEWLTAGTLIDRLMPGTFSGLATLRFNNDVYLSAHRTLGQKRGVYMLSFSRATMKQLLTQRLRMTLKWGGRDGNTVLGAGSFLQAGDTPAVGDFDGDGDGDILRFTPRPVSGDGSAPVYVRRANETIGTEVQAFGREHVWQASFSTAGEWPSVGDFDGDGKSDVISFAQKMQFDATGHPIGLAPVRVALSDGTKFNEKQLWHRDFSTSGQTPMVGDFNGDGKDDVITFSGEAQHDSNGAVLGQAPVQVALSNGQTFGTRNVWHSYFSLAGETPRVGDLNGDGIDDVATFLRAGLTRVYVALSNGSRFGARRLWATDFSPGAEVPLVGDFNADGRDDIMTVVRGSRSGDYAKDIYIAYSSGSAFGPKVLWHSAFVEGDEIAKVIHHSGKDRKTITRRVDDEDKFFSDLVAFGRDGSVSLARSLTNVPFPSGAPWERYKWFPEKGSGAALFPEWIWTDPANLDPVRCLTSTQAFHLGGASGVGGQGFFTSSVRSGGRQGHILQEMSHSVFAACLQTPYELRRDVLGVWHDVYEKQPTLVGGGIGARGMPGCPAEEIYDCRDPEHYFISLEHEYRLNGTGFRNKIRAATGTTKERYTVQYDWLRDHWFNGVEYKTGLAPPISFPADGVQCLRGECSRLPLVIGESPENEE